MGAQVPPIEAHTFREALDTLGYQYWEETENPAYRIFAGSKPRSE
jgi:threonine dehydratase